VYKIAKAYENNELVWDSTQDPAALFEWNYLLTKDKTAIIKEWNQQMTDSYVRAVGTPKGVPLGESDSIYLYDTEDSPVTLAVAAGVTFPVTFNYLFSLETGYKVVPYDIQDAIQSAYSNYSIEDTCFIVRSNKRANQYNQQIRTRILDKDSELSVGDYLMVVKNNYFWLKETDEAGFIANGDIVEVVEIFKFVELYGFKFAKVKIRMVDYPNQKPFETIVLLDTITSESPSLTYEESNALYQEVMKDYEGEPQYRKFLKVKNNEYFNALQVKFSYAITCHKSQGGQWNTVFIEQPYLPDGITVDYVRWLYTAVTRAKDKLYLIGFKDESFEG
jgi:hypothetical protein